MFTGAGFSIGAKNLLGQSLPTGEKLSRMLSTEAGVHDELRLEDAAEEFVDKLGNDQLIEFLMKSYAVYFDKTLSYR